jgi:hypothetical protein
MRRSELLEKVKSLVPVQRRKFIRELLAMDQVTPKPRSTRGRVAWPDVEARACRISGGRVLPNLVLMEREESSF